MTTMSHEPKSVLEVLADIRRTQSKTIESYSNVSYWLLRFENEIGDLTAATTKLCSAVPADPTSPESTGIRRDVAEFRADVTALKGYFAEICSIAKDAQSDTAGVKAKLDTLQTHLEEREL